MDDIAELIRDRIKRRLAKLKLTPITAAVHAGLPRDTIRNLFRGRASVPRADTLAAIAVALETTLSYLMGETDVDDAGAAGAGVPLDRDIHVRMVPIYGPAQAGQWTGDDFLQPPEVRYLPAFSAAFDEYSQLAFELPGADMDAYYAPGDFVIAVPSFEMEPRIGDHAVIARNRGDLMELSVRILERDGDDLYWASKRAGGAKAPRVSIDGDAADDSPPGVVAIVVASYRKLARPDENNRLKHPTWQPRRVSLRPFWSEEDD
jgi:transcriptional regulator with XRE-family HTH domain